MKPFDVINSRSIVIQKSRRGLLAMLLIFTFSGCATLMNGRSQDIGFASNPSGATVIIDGDSLGITPLTVNLTRKHSHIVRFEADGYRIIEFPILRRVSRWVYTPLWPYLPIDYLTGGMFKLTPPRLQVDLYEGSIVPIFDEAMWNIPPLKPTKRDAEILGGVLGGAIVAYSLQSLEPNSGDGQGGFSIVLGWIIGVPMGVHLIGNMGNETGSWDDTVQGTMRGFAGLFALAFIAPDLSINGPLDILLLFPSIAATNGFNKNRRYKIPADQARTGVINFNDSQMSLAIPLIYIRPNPFIIGSLVPTLDLLKLTL